MNSLHLKLLACLTMAIDHIGFLFFPDQVIWRIIGRLSFPLFAFLIAEGYGKTRSRMTYFSRLVIFAAISQAPFEYFNDLAGQDYFLFNIFCTLVLGFIAIVVSEKMQNTVLKIGTVAAIAVFAHFAAVSFGAYGILTIVASRLFIKNKDAGTASLAALPMLEAARLAAKSLQLTQAFALFSLIPIFLYNGEQGPRISKWWFYWFYPIHFVALSLIYLYLTATA